MIEHDAVVLLMRTQNKAPETSEAVKFSDKQQTRHH